MDTHNQSLGFLGIFVLYLIFCSVQHRKHQCYIWAGTHMLWNTDGSYVMVMKIPPACRRQSQAHWSIQIDPSQMIMLFLCCEYYKLFLHLLKSVYLSWGQAWGAVEIWALKSVLPEFYCAMVSFLQSSKYKSRSLQRNSHMLSRYRDELFSRGAYVSPQTGRKPPRRNFLLLKLGVSYPIGSNKAHRLPYKMYFNRQGSS